MSRVSNAHTVAVQAVSNTALFSAAASMSAGQWLNFGTYTGGGAFTATAGLSLLQSGSSGASGIRTPYCSEFVYDVTNKVCYVHSGDHNQDAIWFRYNESTNTLVVDHTASWMVVNNNGIHGYDHNVVAKGQFYSRKIDELWLRKWDGPGTTTWTNTSTMSGPGGNISAAGHCWHAGLNKILVHQIGSNPNGILVGYDPDTASWTTYSTTLSGTGDPHNFAAYNPTSQIAWFGGGNNCLLSWTIGNAGTSSITAVSTPLPNNTGPSNAGGLVLPNPHNGDFTVWYDANNWYDFNATTRVFTKKSAQATAFVTNMASQNDVNVALMGGVIGCSLPAPYNVFFFWKAWARNTPGEMWLHKPVTPFTTTFPATENPISQSGAWRNGGPSPGQGLAWHNNQTTPGKAFATAIDTDGVTDNVSVYVGTQFTTNQFAEATIFKTAGYGSGVVTHELEVFVNMTINANSITGYELYLNIAGNHTLVRWDGAHNVFTPLASNNAGHGSMPAYADGDVIRIERNGSTLNCYHRTAAGSFTLYTTFNDNTFTNGNPGFGTNPANDAGGSPIVSSAGFSKFVCGNFP